MCARWCSTARSRLKTKKYLEARAEWFRRAWPPFGWVIGALFFGCYCFLASSTGMFSVALASITPCLWASSGS